jgi:hypothetical protein
MYTIPDQQTHGRDCVAYTLASIAIVMRNMTYNDMGHLTRREAGAFIALEKQVSLLAEKLMPNREAWQRWEAGR